MKTLNRKETGLTELHPTKILQFGEGNFLRAFVDWIIDQMNEKASFHGSVEIIQPIEKGMGDMINQQDGLYHVILNGIINNQPSQEIRLIKCVKKVINPFTDYESFLKTSENPDLEFIVSNTTEAGIAFNPADQNILNQLPSGFPGKLTQWLFHRFNYFKGNPEKGLILFPCELIDKNGTNLKKTVEQYIDLWNLPVEFKRWVQEHNLFCNTLVDRIVPGFPKENIKTLQEHVGYQDNLMVTAELFHLWVIEGPGFIASKFPSQRAGLQVKFVDDLSPYRTRKVRILNGAHTAMVPVAYLKGLRWVSEAVNNPEVGRFIKETIFEEIIPTLDLAEKELIDFANDVITRFRNPAIQHELSSIALNSISKFKVRVLPSLLTYAKNKGTLPPHLVTSFAALIRFYQGSWKGNPLPVQDGEDVVIFFREAWKITDQEERLNLILSHDAFWGENLTLIPDLQKAVGKALTNIEKDW